MRHVGQIQSNAAGFPNAQPSGIKGMLTMFFIKPAALFGLPEFIPHPLFAPALMYTGYRTMFQYIDCKDSGTGLNFGLSNISGQFPMVGAVYPAAPMSFGYQDSAAAPEVFTTWDFKEAQYMEVMRMLSGGDLLKITNIRLRYKLKRQSGLQRNRKITFFDQDIFGRPTFQQLTLNQYFDPTTNKTSNDDIQPVETIDVPVNWFASNTSGLCLEIEHTNIALEDFFNVTFMVEKWFNHVGRNKTLF